MAQQVTFEQLKEKYTQLLQRNKKLKDELRKCVNNQQILEAGLKERDDAIEERSKSISELLKTREDLLNELNALKQQVHEPGPPPDESQETLGELASAFNAERRELLTELDALKKQGTEHEKKVQELENENAQLRAELADLNSFKLQAEQVANSSEDAQKQLLLRIAEIETLKRKVKEAESREIQFNEQQTQLQQFMAIQSENRLTTSSTMTSSTNLASQRPSAGRTNKRQKKSAR